MERFAEEAGLLEQLRLFVAVRTLRLQMIEGKQAEGAKFSDYFDHQEPIAKVPSHRILAMLRGRNEGFSLKFTG